FISGPADGSKNRVKWQMKLHLLRIEFRQRYLPCAVFRCRLPCSSRRPFLNRSRLGCSIGRHGFSDATGGLRRLHPHGHELRARIDSSRANSEAALKRRKANVVVKNLIPMFDELALTSIRRNPQKTRVFSIKNRDKPLNWFPFPGKLFLELLRINQEKPNFA